MTRSCVIAHIRSALERMCIPQVQAFSEHAHLNQDLYLDSVLILQLLVHLELECGFEIPEQALSADHFVTVSALADFLLTLPQSGSTVAGARR